ncbi:MAG: dialkylresorcinol condensing enzyme DarA [Brumimicrobium sp.]|nr:dialkylresorcinol condensing enzyme DarA [Brumimicrobium sp.]
MKRNVLVIYYTQTGQLKEIADNLCMPFVGSNNYNIDYYQIKPVQDYTFPWKSKDFYNAFPESFRQIPIPIHHPEDEILNKEYDLVILAYQIWFLTPSIPFTSFMKSPFAEKLLKGKKVITVVGCRNMWAKAQEKVKGFIKNVGGVLVGQIALVDKHLNHVSVVTIAHWMMGGKKDKKYGIFPLPGVSDSDIKNSSKFGELILEAANKDNYHDLQNNIIDNGGTPCTPFIIFMDETANKMFTKWSNFILKSNSNRALKVTFFKIYLLTAIWIISPIVYILFLMAYPLRINKTKKKRLYYTGVV